MPAKLTAQDIYDKEFTVDARGYSANEVDSYLDQIIEDYQEYEEQTQKFSSALVSCDQKIKELTDENAALQQNAGSLNQELDQLRETVESLQQQNGALRQQLQEAQNSLAQTRMTPAVPAASANLEERIARLEKAVFHSEKTETAQS